VLGGTLLGEALSLIDDEGVFRRSPAVVEKLRCDARNSRSVAGTSP